MPAEEPRPGSVSEDTPLCGIRNAVALSVPLWLLLAWALRALAGG